MEKRRDDRVRHEAVRVLAVLQQRLKRLFGRELGSEFFFIDVPDWAWFAAAIAGIVGSIVVVVRRFAGIVA